MIRELDEFLEQDLDDPAAPAGLRFADVIFRVPDRGFRPARLTLSLFLYDVKENRQLRDPVPVFERVGAGWVRRRPPMRVDCTYLVTAWSELQPEEAAAAEHTLLARALAWLGRRPYVRTPAQLPPYGIPVVVGQPDDDRRLGEFWSALGVPPRAAFNLVATVPIALPMVTTPIRPVATSEIRIHRNVTGDPARDPLLDTVYTIGGTVTRADNGRPIEDSEVTIVELGRSMRTKEDGRFRFDLLAAGPLTLRFSATGLVTRELQVVVPSNQFADYDVSLSA